jgi:hypothetical protein
MPVTEFTLKDVMRGRPDHNVFLRTDLDDLVQVSCYSKYDPQLNKQVRILRQVEVQEDEEWKPYPVVSWLDGVTHEDQLQTMVLVVPIGDTLTALGTTDGVPDGELMLEAEKAGIYTAKYG